MWSSQQGSCSLSIVWTCVSENKYLFKYTELFTFIHTLYTCTQTSQQLIERAVCTLGRHGLSLSKKHFVNKSVYMYSSICILSYSVFLASLQEYSVFPASLQGRHGSCSLNSVWTHVISSEYAFIQIDSFTYTYIYFYIHIYGLPSKASGARGVWTDSLCGNMWYC